MSKVILIASHRIDETHAEEFARRVNFHVHNCVAREPGCLHFSVSHDPQTGLWHYVEVYASQKDLDAHNDTEHFKKHIAGVKHMITGDINVTVAEVREYAAR